MNNPNSIDALLFSLQEEIDQFKSAKHDSVGLADDCLDVFLAARTLATQYYSWTMLNDKINCTERTKVIDALSDSLHTLPTDSNSPYIHSYRIEIAKMISKSLRIPTELLEIWNEEGWDEDDDD